MSREIRLSGSDITVLKALGTSGTPVPGRMLLDRLGEIDEMEVVETLQGLIEMDHVLSSKVNIMKLEDVERSIFRVNPTNATELRDALRPGGRKRDEDRGRRQRRR